MKRSLLLIAGVLWCAAVTAERFYVKADGTNSNAFIATSWEKACNNLQSVIDVANRGDEIWVAKGIYSVTSRTAPFVIDKGVHIYGGFPATGNPDMNSRNPQTQETVLSGRLSSASACHILAILSADGNVILDGFIFQNANGDSSASTTIRGIDIPGNNGGGIYVFNSSVIAARLTFRNIQVTGKGAAVYEEIPAGMDAGNYNSCLFADNTAGYGGVYSHKALTTYNASADTERPLMFINCTFFGNKVTEEEGGDILYYEKTQGEKNRNVSPQFLNCIIYSDRSEYERGHIINGNNLSIVDYKDIGFANVLTDYYTESEGLGSNPLTVNVRTGATKEDIKLDANYSPLKGSWAVNRGNTEYLHRSASNISTDITGASRIRLGYPDLGAFETLNKGVLQLLEDHSVQLPYGDILKITNDAWTDDVSFKFGSSYTGGIEYIKLEANNSTARAVRAGGKDITISVTVEDDNWEPAYGEYTVSTVKRVISISKTLTETGTTFEVLFNNMLIDDLVRNKDYSVTADISKLNNTPSVLHVQFLNTIASVNYAFAEGKDNFQQLFWLIHPTDNQGKEYGGNNPEEYGYAEIENTGFTGKLAREMGEDPGRYRYTIGTLSHSNYPVVFPTYIDRFFEITKCNPRMVNWPVRITLLEGQKLSQAILWDEKDQEIKQPLAWGINGKIIEGIFHFENGNAVPQDLVTPYKILFTPSDTARYTVAEKNVTVSYIRGTALLKNITVVPGAPLSPAFDPLVFTYVTRVAINEATIRISVDIDAVTARLDPNLLSDVGSKNVALGENKFYINVVSLKDATIKTQYTVYVLRGDPVEGNGIENITVGGLKVYPTVTDGTIYIETVDGNVPEVRVYNLTGKLLLNARQNSINLSSYPNGLYFLQADGKTIKVVKK
ncbi:hypothetical protein Barb4_02450 [Bacteroidales bacterium Barb4]|nr:hypothetical protein Barb4_02450 [Bacteroidales bacterium Barb4]